MDSQQYTETRLDQTLAAQLHEIAAGRKPIEVFHAVDCNNREGEFELGALEAGWAPLFALVTAGKPRDVAKFRPLIESEAEEIVGAGLLAAVATGTRRA